MQTNTINKKKNIKTKNQKKIYKKIKNFSSQYRPVNSKHYAPCWQANETLCNRTKEKKNDKKLLTFYKRLIVNCKF